MFLDEKRTDEFHHNTEEVSTYCGATTEYRAIFSGLKQKWLGGSLVFKERERYKTYKYKTDIEGIYFSMYYSRL